MIVDIDSFQDLDNQTKTKYKLYQYSRFAYYACRILVSENNIILDSFNDDS